MSITYKVLGQVESTANTNVDMYTVPSNTSTVCSTLVVCNRGLSTTFRVAVRPIGDTLQNKHYIAYDTTLASKDSFYLTMGITLGATDVVTVWAENSNVSFSLFGSEIAWVLVALAIKIV